MIEAIVRFFDEDHAIHNIDPAVVADNWERTIWNESYEVEDYQRRAKVALDEGDTYEKDAQGIDICPGAAPGDFFYATMKKHMRDQNVPNQAQHEQPAAVEQVKEALLNSLEFRKGQLSGPDIQRRRFRLSFQESLQGFVSQLPPGGQLKLLDVVAMAAAMETDEWEKAHGLEQQYTHATEDLERELDMWATCWDSTDEDEDNQLTGQQRFENYVRITHQGKYIQTQEEIDLELILLAGFEEDEEDAANMSTEDAYADPTEYDYVQSLSQKSSAAAGEVNALESPASPPLWDQGPNENVDIGSDHEQDAPDWSLPQPSVNNDVEAAVNASQVQNSRQAGAPTNPATSYSSSVQGFKLPGINAGNLATSNVASGVQSKSLQSPLPQQSVSVVEESDKMDYEESTAEATAHTPQISQAP
jgi:hypothetical protein